MTNWRVRITDADGSNERWLTDCGSSKQFVTQDRSEAEYMASERRRFYPHTRYEVVTADQTDGAT